MAQRIASESSPLLESRTTSTVGEPGRSPDRTHAISALHGSVLTGSIFLLLFLSTCNISVLTTVQSAIVTELHVTTESSWFVSALLIGTAAVGPVAGKLAQVFTDHVYLFTSMMLEVVGMTMVALTPNVATFLTGRFISGCGSAALAPLAVILIREHAPERYHAVLFGAMNCAYTAGVACGAIIGGTLEPIIGWRAIFGLQCPFVLALATAACASMRASRRKADVHSSDLTTLQKLSQLDYFGILALMTSVVFLLVSLSAPQLLVRPIMLSAACFMLFVFVEVKWARDPVIPPVVLRSRAVMLTGVATIGVMSARWAVLFQMPTYGIAVRLWSAERAGSLLVPTNVGFGLGGVAAGWLHIRRTQSYYVSCLICFALFAVSEAGIAALVGSNLPVWVLLLALLLNGALIGALLVYTLTHVLFLTAEEHSIVVIPVVILFRTLAGAFGSSFSGGVFLRALQTTLQHKFDQAGLSGRTELIERLLSQPALVPMLRGLEQEVAIDSYTESLRTLYFIGAGLVLVTLVLQAGTGWRAPAALKANSESTPRATAASEDDE